MLVHGKQTITINCIENGVYNDTKIYKPISSDSPMTGEGRGPSFGVEQRNDNTLNKCYDRDVTDDFRKVKNEKWWFHLKEQTLF